MTNVTLMNGIGKSEDCIWVNRCQIRLCNLDFTTKLLECNNEKATGILEAVFCISCCD